MILKDHKELFQRDEENSTLIFEDLPHNVHSVEKDNIIWKGRGELFPKV